jgi:acetoin utilization protein AcuC
MTATDEPHSLFGVNSLPPEERDGYYRALVPEALLARFGLARESELIAVRAPDGSATVELEVRHAPEAEDPLLYLHLTDTMNLQIELLLVVLNDPSAPRFATDRLPDGTPTHFGTVARHLEAEAAALRAGLAPGQVRRGLGLGRAVVACLDAFAARLGHALWMLQPLAYHNAILFERWGFAYLGGRQLMESIDAELRPGGELIARLDGSTPFRAPEAWRTIRGRSWAIQDGILEAPFRGVEMYKQVGKHAGLSTFPDGSW